jgi:hypothetical protein
VVEVVEVRVLHQPLVAQLLHTLEVVVVRHSPHQLLGLVV